MVLQYALLSGGLTLFVEHFQFLFPAAYFDRTLQEIVTKTLLGSVAQSVTYWTADTGVESSIQARSNTFMEIDHEIISTIILLFPLIQERLLLVTSESMWFYMHKVLVNC